MNVNARLIKLSSTISYYLLVAAVTLGLFAPPIHQLLHAEHIDRSCEEGHSSTSHFETIHDELDCEACSIGTKKGLEDDSTQIFSFDLVSNNSSLYTSVDTFYTQAAHQRGPPQI